MKETILIELFQLLDLNNDDYIEKDEWVNQYYKYILENQLSIRQQDEKYLEWYGEFEDLDGNSDGFLTEKEFEKWVYPENSDPIKDQAIHLMEILTGEKFDGSIENSALEVTKKEIYKVIGIFYEAEKDTNVRDEL